MKAFIVNRYGKKEKLQLKQITDLVVKESDILVKVHSAGVNLLDSKIRNGEFKMILPYKTPFTLGHGVSGVVTQVGSRVSKFKVGDEVYERAADHRIGTFAEYISMNENDVALKPKNLSMEEAASIPLVGLTAKRLDVNYSFLFMRTNGNQLTEITSLINAGVIKPVIDRIFPFEQTNEALAFVEAGRAKGKVVVKVK